MEQLSLGDVQIMTNKCVHKIVSLMASIVMVCAQGLSQTVCAYVLVCTRDVTFFGVGRIAKHKYRIGLPYSVSMREFPYRS